MSEQDTRPNVASGGTEHEIAARIFDAMDDLDSFEVGNPPPESTGSEAEPAGAEPDAEDADFDAEATAALTGEDEDDESSEDEPEEDDEDEAEDEESEDESSDEDESEDGEEPDRFTVRVDGEDLEVTLDELLAGYSRTASFTRKSQQLANERKEFEGTRAELQRQREEYGARLQQLEQHFAQALPKEPAQDAPNEEWVAYQRAKQQLDAVQAEQQRNFAEWQQQQNALLEQVVEQETEALRERVPEWRDDAKMSAGLQSLFTYATQVLGFDEDTVRNVRDHRLILLLKKAAEADEIEQARKTVKSKTRKAKTLKPGSRPSQKSKARAKNRAAHKKGREALRESGHIRDAASLFEQSGVIDDLL